MTLRTRTVLIWSLLLVSFIYASLAGAQSLPSNTDAKEMLDRVFIAMNLRKPASLPFHLRAHVRYEVDGKTDEGTYELMWSAAQTYREAFSMGGAEEIDVALGDKMYVSRNSIAITLPLRNVRELLQFPVPGDLMVDLDITKISSEQIDGQSRTCIHVMKRDANTKQQASELACFDPATNEITSINAEGNLKSKPTNIQLNSFKSLGVKRYPTHMTSVVNPENMLPANMEVTVDTLEVVTKFAGDPFVPPAGSVARDWCLTLAAAPSLEDASRPTFTKAELKNLTPFFVIVGADGRVVQSDPVLPASDQKNEDRIQSWLKTARFPIQNCGDKPVGYETFYTPSLKFNY